MGSAMLSRLLHAARHGRDASAATALPDSTSR